MTRYERIFGAGPRGILITIGLFGVAWGFKEEVALPAITENTSLRWSVFVLSVIGAMGLAFWSAKSLPPKERGQKLATLGAYRYFRHPIYATFVSGFDFGLAMLLNNWIYLLWAILVHCYWHANVVSEERLMRDAFPGENDAYCSVTGRFFPRISSFKRRE